MTQTSVLDRPASSTTPIARIPTRYELFRTVRDALLEQPDRTFGALYRDIEHVPVNELRAVAVAGTAFETVAHSLADAGVPTDGTTGSIMDAMQLSQDDVHKLVCYCHGEIITGPELADRFGNLQNA